MAWIAYVDESMRQRHDESGIYVLAAAMFDDVDASELRLVMRSLVRGRRNFHWRHEEPADRRKAVASIADLGALHLVVVGAGLDCKRQERGRRQCLTRLLWELQDCGVSQVMLDARRPAQNQRDMRLLAALRARQILGAGLRIDHVSGRREPLEWLADIVAGSVSAAFGDDNWEYLDCLERVMAAPPIMIDIE